MSGQFALKGVQEDRQQEPGLPAAMPVMVRRVPCKPACAAGLPGGTLCTSAPRDTLSERAT